MFLSMPTPRYVLQHSWYALSYSLKYFLHWNFNALHLPGQQILDVLDIKWLHWRQRESDTGYKNTLNYIRYSNSKEIPNNNSFV